MELEQIQPDETQLGLVELQEKARGYALNSKAANTLRAYRADWRKFTTWCEERQLAPLPAAVETVAMFAAELAGTEKASTLQRRMSAIAEAHRAAGFESPARAGIVQSVLAGVRRAHGSAQEGKAALLTQDILAMVATCDEDLAGLRDKALILLGFAGAFRRGELVALQVEDLAFTSSGLVVTVRRSKTDQEGQGAKKGIPFGASERSCPVHAVRKWLEAARLSCGPVFRGVSRWGQVQTTPLSGRAVALIVKKLATAAGLNPKLYAGHSLRAGLATQAAMNGVEERLIQNQTGHKSTNVLRRYIRDGNLFRSNAASSIGL